MSALSPIHSDANYTSAEAHATDGPPREATITNSDGGTTGRSINYMLESIPIGMFHYRLLSICGLSFMADAMEVSLLSFMAPCVGLDWDLTDSEVAGIASMVFAGILLGSLFWGPIADIYGRRLSYLWGAVLIIVGGIVSAFCESYASLIIFRAIVGFGVGGISVPFDLLAEYTPASHRGQYLMYIEYFWTLGSVFVAASAWIFLSAYDWRVLTLVTAVPVSIGLTWSICYLPESPRWLLQQGRIEEAEKCIANIGVVNNFRMEPFKLNPKHTPAALDDSHGSSGSTDILNPSGNGHSEGKQVSIMDFLKRDQLGLTIPLWMVWFAFGFAYYGIVLFVAKVFEVDNGDDAEGGESCSFTYDDIFISAVSEVLGVTVTALIIDRVGRVKTQSLLYGTAGFSVLFLGMPIDIHFRTFMSVLGRSAAMGAASATWVATPELYPTHTRATAHAIANSISHFGGFLVPYLIDSATIPATGVVLAIMNFVGMFSVFFLPETLGVELDKSVRGPKLVAELANTEQGQSDENLGGDEVLN